MGYSVFESISKGFKKVLHTLLKKYIIHSNPEWQRKISQYGNCRGDCTGRVWSGKDAVKNGLVDTLGGLQEAIKSAAKLAELDKYNLVDYPKYEEDFESMILGAFSQAQSKLFQNPLEKYTSQFIELSLMEGIQTEFLIR